MSVARAFAEVDAVGQPEEVFPVDFAVCFGVNAPGFQFQIVEVKAVVGGLDFVGVGDGTVTRPQHPVVQEGEVREVHEVFHCAGRRGLPGVAVAEEDLDVRVFPLSARPLGYRGRRFFQRHPDESVALGHPVALHLCARGDVRPLWQGGDLQTSAVTVVLPAVVGAGQTSLRGDPAQREGGSSVYAQIVKDSGFAL